jgi:hypothetical protein
MKTKSKLTNNLVDHPRHYTSHPSGIEAIELCGKMGFCTGNAFKYLFRFENKWSPVEDLRKARWYIDREIYQETGKPPIKSLKLEGYWHENCTKNSVINPVVGKNPGNAERALWHIWLYELYNKTGTSYLGFLYIARHYVNKLIHQRSRKTHG